MSQKKTVQIKMFGLMWTRRIPFCRPFFDQLYGRAVQRKFKQEFKRKGIPFTETKNSNGTTTLTASLE